MQQLVSSRTSILNAKLFRSGPDNAEVWSTYLHSFPKLGQPVLHPIATALLHQVVPGAPIGWTEVFMVPEAGQDGMISLKQLKELGEDVCYPACALLRMTLWTSENKRVLLNVARGVSPDSAVSAAEDDIQLDIPATLVVGNAYSPKAVVLKHFLQGFFEAIAEIERRLAQHDPICSAVSCEFSQWQITHLGTNGYLELSYPEWNFVRRA